VVPCDRSEQPIATNGEMADELTRTRRQRDDCADRIDGVRQWRGDALKRSEAAANALPK